MKNLLFKSVVLTILAVLIYFPHAKNVLAASVTPVFKNDNVTCKSAGYDFEYKLEPVRSGTFSVNNVVFKVTVNGQKFNWTSSVPLDAVFVKGGTGVNMYTYSPEVKGDTSLNAPINPNTNQPYGLSHISFCYDYELDVSKTATTSYTEKHKWEIKKEVTPKIWDIFVGDSVNLLYTINLNKTGSEKTNYLVKGNILIANNSPVEAQVIGVKDSIGTITVNVTCPKNIPFKLIPGGSITCNYEVALDVVSDGTNKVEVATTGVVHGNTAIRGFKAADSVVKIVDNEVSVVDGTNNWKSTGSNTYTYEEDFKCSKKEIVTKTNTVKLYGDNNVVLATDSEDAEIDCHELTITKNANTSYDNAWNWDMQKSVSPAKWDLFNGDTATSKYTLSVTKSGPVNSNYSVKGKITVENSSPIMAVLNSVSDIVDASYEGTVDCGVSFPYMLFAGKNLECTYSVTLPNNVKRKNVATAIDQNYDYAINVAPTLADELTYKTEVPVDFANAAVTEKNKTVNIKDSDGKNWSLDNTQTLTYEKTFDCLNGSQKYDNTASIVETELTDDAAVDVNCYDPIITKSAVSSFDRIWDWSIDKTAGITQVLLSTGQAYPLEYKVNLTAVSKDSNYTVAGNIKIQNPSISKAVINSVTDLAGTQQIPVNCGVAMPYILSPGETLNCTYNSSLSDGTIKENIAKVTIQNYEHLVDGNINPGTTKEYIAKASVSFDEPTHVFDKSVNVTDDKYGNLGVVNASELPKTFTYTSTFGPFLACGAKDNLNTASLLTNDNKIIKKDQWSVKTDVPCQGGCTLTPGYWKNHSSYGPARYDDTWKQIGENTVFFLSGNSYYQVLWTEPDGGNVYYNLARAYIATKLNGLNGASIPAEVQSSYDKATELFNKYTPAQVLDLKGKTGTDVRTEFTNYAQTLDKFNNGLLGTPHCSE